MVIIQQSIAIMGEHLYGNKDSKGDLEDFTQDNSCNEANLEGLSLIAVSNYVRQ